MGVHLPLVGRMIMVVRTVLARVGVHFSLSVVLVRMLVLVHMLVRMDVRVLVGVKMGVFVLSFLWGPPQDACAYSIYYLMPSLPKVKRRFHDSRALAFCASLLVASSSASRREKNLFYYSKQRNTIM